MNRGKVTRLFAPTVAAILVAITAFAQSANATAPAQPVSAPVPQSAPALSQADLETFFDGMIPYGLDQGDIAGAEVVVVKDGQILFAKGYGYADAARRTPVSVDDTMFRVGSVSKLFVWTAVMQLAQQGKLDLDRNVDDYLDFKIAPANGGPVTLRELMTHTAGFEVTVKDLLFYDPARVPELGSLLRRNQPKRIFAPGKVVAYSNYGAALAGYIVQRVSGEPFAAYAQRHILAPIGMTHSTFVQPLPAAWRRSMSQGYLTASGPAQPYELVGLPPVGALAATGPDMARFMIAHLHDGAFGDVRILDAKTARFMHAPQRTSAPGLNGFALGFYEETHNGHRVIGHSGDTQFFHSDLHLLPDADVGLYVSFNSRGADSAAYGLRTTVFHGFMDRYFPLRTAPLPTASTAVADSRLVSGVYVSSIREESGIFRFFTLFDQTQVTARPDGTIEASSITDVGRKPIRWREIGPLVFVPVNGEASRLAFVKTANGRIDHLAWDDDPTFVLLPAPTGEGAWVLPALITSLAAFALALLVWAAGWIVRRRYSAPLQLEPWVKRLHALSRIGGLVWIGVFVCWFLLILDANGNLPALSDAIVPQVRLFCAFGLVGLVGAAMTVAAAIASWRSAARGRVGKLADTGLAAAAVYVSWFTVAYNLVSFSGRF